MLLPQMRKKEYRKGVWKIDPSIFKIFLSFFFNYTSSYRQRRQWHPTLVLLPGKSHGWRSLVGCSPWGPQESDMTERLYFHFSLLSIGEGNGNPLQCSCLENPRDGGAWWAAVYGVAQSRTRLKRLSSSSNILTEEKLSSTDSKQAKADPRPGARGSSHLHLCSLYSCQCLLISFTLYILWTQEQKSEILKLENSPSVY